MTVKRVIFIRPGETDWNRELRWQGWVAAPMNEHGRRQVQRLASFIRNIGIGALYTSDLKRALETAELLTERLGFAAVADPRLRERSIGAWQGLTREEMREWYKDDYDRLQADPENFQIPGGESRQDVKKRMMTVFDEILAQSRAETVGIITHTTAVHALLDVILPGGFAGEEGVRNTSVTTIVREENAWRLVASDDVTHLEGMDSKKSPELESLK